MPTREWFKDPQNRNQYHREYYEKNKEKRRKYLAEHARKRRKANPERVRATQRKHYQNNKETLREASRRFQDKRNLFYWSLKSQFTCMDCGETNPACLDFHHRDPREKTLNIGQFARAVSREKLLAEIKKCDVICSNCHRKRHHSEREGLRCEVREIKDREKIVAEAKAIYDAWHREVYTRGEKQ